jgi:tetratricopeptide (TPR) repeat protein
MPQSNPSSYVAEFSCNAFPLSPTLFPSLKFKFKETNRLLASLWLAWLFFSSFAFASDSPQALLAAGQVDQAMQILNRQIQTQPTAEAYNLLCRAYFALDDWDSGIPDCEKAVKLAPNNGLYHLWMGRIYGEKADHAGVMKAAGLAKKVRTQFESAVQFDPDNWQAHTDLAEFYLEAPGIVGGGEDKALAQAAVLQTLNPPMADWVRARIAQKKKQNAAAEQDYQASIQASHGAARPWVSLAGFYKRVGRLDDMQNALRSMESASLDQPAALMDAASLLFQTGRDPAMAIRLVRRYLAAGPVEEWPAFKAHYLLGEFLQKQGDFPSASEQFRITTSMAHTFHPAEDASNRMGR